MLKKLLFWFYTLASIPYSIIFGDFTKMIINIEQQIPKGLKLITSNEIGGKKTTIELRTLKWVQLKYAIRMQ